MESPAKLARCEASDLTNVEQETQETSLSYHFRSLDPAKDKATEVTLKCAFNHQHLILKVRSNSNILQISFMIGRMLQCPHSDLVLICKGEVISRHPMFSLEDLGFSTPCSSSSDGSIKLLISRRPPGPTWIKFTAAFLCTTSLKPLTFRMHSASPVANVKRQVQESLRCHACLSIHSADGALLPTAISLRDLGVADGGRLYCRILAQEPALLPQRAVADAAAAVREQIRIADRIWRRGPPSAGSKRPLDDPEAGDEASIGVGVGGGGGEQAGHRSASLFVAMRQGFLLPSNRPSSRPGNWPACQA
jgi:hypothetical protein